MPRKKKVVEAEIKTLVIEDTETPEVVEDDFVDLLLKDGKLTVMISEVLYLGYLGATLVPGTLPRLRNLPFMVQLRLSKEANEKYMNNIDRPEFCQDTNYTKHNVSSIDPLKFIQSILDIGAKGGILVDKKIVQNGSTFLAQVLVEGELETSPTITVLPS
jgi:hypothetical protein